MKTLKFSKDLIPLIIFGEKTVTWRLFDDKDLKEGDEVLFSSKETGEGFARVLLTEVEEKTFKELTDKDKENHESFESDERMLETYSKYYNTDVNMDTPLKVVRFKIIERL